MMQNPNTTRIRGAHVVAFDALLGSHVLLEGAEVVFAADRIIHVGGPYPGAVTHEIDGRNRLLIPRLIDAHALMDIGVHLLLWDRDRDEGYRPRHFVEGQGDPFTPEQTRAGAQAMLSMLVRSGVTTFCGINAMVFKRWDDALWEPPLYAEVANQLGLRAYLSHHYRSAVPIIGDAERELVDEAAGEQGLQRGIDFVARAARGEFGPRIHGMLFPYTQDTVSDALLRETSRAARELGVVWRMHTAQSVGEVERTVARHQRSPIERLDHLGVLGPEVLLTHVLHGLGHQGTNALADHEVALLAKSGTNVGHTPWIYLFGGRLLRAFGRYRRAGINVAIGTDTYPGDMLQEMHMAALLGKVAEGATDATISGASPWEPKQILRWYAPTAQVSHRPATQFTAWCTTPPFATSAMSGWTASRCSWLGRFLAWTRRQLTGAWQRCSRRSAGCSAVGIPSVRRSIRASGRTSPPGGSADEWRVRWQ